MLHQPCTKLCPRIFIWPLLLQYSSNTNGEDLKKKGKKKLDISVHFVEKTKQQQKKWNEVNFCIKTFQCSRAVVLPIAVTTLHKYKEPVKN